jgi:hypothetical protein
MGRLGAISFGGVRVYTLWLREIWPLSTVFGVRQTDEQGRSHDSRRVEVCLVDGDLYIGDCQAEGKGTLNFLLKSWGGPWFFCQPLLLVSHILVIIPFSLQ